MLGHFEGSLAKNYGAGKELTKGGLRTYTISQNLDRLLTGAM